MNRPLSHLMRHTAHEADPETWRARLAQGADPNALGNDGQTPLAWLGDMIHLADLGLNPTVDNWEKYYTGLLTCVRLLLEAGADPDQPDQAGQPAINHFPQVEIARLDQELRACRYRLLLERCLPVGQADLPAPRL